MKNIVKCCVNVILITLLTFLSNAAFAQTAQTSKVYLTNTAGKTLADGTVYMVNSSMTIGSRTGSELNGLKVAEGATATIFIPAGVTLTVYGKDASGITGGGAGILVPATSTLYITGAGTLNVYGGNAADGEDGKNGGNGSATISVSGTFNASWKYSMSSGAGGAGGYGGGGAGAAIGGNGANGGAGGESPSGSSFNGTKAPSDDKKSANGEPQSSDFTLEANRKYIGKAGEDALGMGNVYILGTVTVNATAGKVGEGGEGGTGDKYATQNATFWLTRNNVVGGGGGGGAGGGGGKTTDYAIAGGAGGASGGSAGGSGASDYAQTFTSVSNTNSYSNGGGATGYGQGGNNGKAGAGTRDAGYKTGWSGSGQYYNCQGGYGCNVSNIPGENGDNGSLTIKGSATLGGTKVRPADNTIAATNTLGVPVQLKTMISVRNHGGDVADQDFEWRIGEMMPDLQKPTREGYIFVGYYTEPDGGGKQIYHNTCKGEYCCDFVQPQTLHALWKHDNYTFTWKYTYADPSDHTKAITLEEDDRCKEATVTLLFNDGTKKNITLTAGSTIGSGTLTDPTRSEASIKISIADTESLVAPNITVTEAMAAKMNGIDIDIPQACKDKGYKISKVDANHGEAFYAPGRIDLPWEIIPNNSIDQSYWPKAIYVKVLQGDAENNVTLPIIEHTNQAVRCDLANGKYTGSFPVKENIDGTTDVAYYRIQIVSVDNNGKESHFETYSPALISTEVKHYIDDATDYTIHYNATIPVVELNPNDGVLTTNTPRYAWESSISTSDNYAATREGCDFLGWSTTKYTESKQPSTDYTNEFPIVGASNILYSVWQDVQAPQVVFGDYDEAAKQQPFTISDNMSGVQSLEYFLSTTAVEPSSVSSWTNQSTSQPVQIPNDYKEQPKAYLYLKATDIAGNVQYYSKEIDVDPKAPTIVVVDNTRDNKVVKDKIDGSETLVVCQRKDASQDIIPLTCTATIEDNVELKSVSVTMNGTDISSQLTGNTKSKTLIMTPPAITDPKAEPEANVYVITATDYIGNVTTQKIAVFNAHVWAKEWTDVEPTATTPGRLSHKECAHCHIIILLEATRDEIDTTDPAQAAKASIPQGSVLVRGIVDHTDTPPTRGILGFDPFINTAIQLACGKTDSEEIKLTAPSRLDGADAATDFKFLYMDKDDNDKDVKVENNITKPLLLNLNGQSIQKANGDRYGDIDIPITGHENVTILLTDNGELPYTNKSSVSKASPIKYARNVSTIQKDKWQALYLPFKVPTGEGYTLGEIVGANFEGSMGAIEVSQVIDGEVDANTPCFIKSNNADTPTTPGTTITVAAGNGYGLVAADASGSKSYIDIAIKGSLTNTDHVATAVKSFWVVTNGGKLGWAAAGAHQRPYRWVIYDNSVSSGAKPTYEFIISDGEEDVTGIKDIQEKNRNSRGIYTLNGVKMPDGCQLPAGIYIVDGKKMVIK